MLWLTSLIILLAQDMECQGEELDKDEDQGLVN